MLKIPRIRLGIELECIAPDCDSNNDKVLQEARKTGKPWQRGGDGSIRTGGDGQGYEYKSPPISLREARNQIPAIMKAMQYNGYRVNSSCGIHVHIGFLGEPHGKLINKLYAMGCYLEDTIMTLVPPHRKATTNQYAGVLHKVIPPQLAYEVSAEFILATMYRLPRPSSESAKEIPEPTSPDETARIVQMRKNEKYNSARYSWVNLHSYNYRKTVEFRSLEATMDAVRVLSWIELLYFFVRCALQPTIYRHKSLQCALMEGGARKKTAEKLIEGLICAE